MILKLCCFLSCVVNGWKEFTRFPVTYRETIENRLKFASSVVVIGNIVGIQAVVAKSPPIGAVTANKAYFYGDLQNILNSEATTLTKRAFSEECNRYEPGLEEEDVFYPKIFQGKWNVTSKFVKVAAPIGVEAFGGQLVFDAAKKDINSTLSYVAKFKDGSNETVIADRLYNVESIAEASMGRNSILNDAQLDDNLARRLRLTVSPQSSKGVIFDIELLTSDRQFSLLDSPLLPLSSFPASTMLEAMERTAQIIRVRPEDGSASTALPLRKNIETITLYLVLDNNTIRGVQRTATFLSPYDPRYSLASSRNPAVADTAVDLRTYELFYKRIQ